MTKYHQLLLAFIILFFTQSSFTLEIYRTGSPQDVSRLTKQLICLAGGGRDSAWGQGWKELLKSSDGGDILIIRGDSKRGEYEDWIYHDQSKLGFPRVNSVTTLSLSKEADANDPRSERAVEQAEMIVFAGGNQTDYISWFEKSRMGNALKKAIEIKKIPVAGTSAGMAILAGITYRARFNSPVDGKYLKSEDVLQNPTSPLADLYRGLYDMPFLKNVITETHFAQRARYGRVVGFMAKAVHSHMASVQKIQSISSDYGTAFCYHSSGLGTVYGIDNVFFMRALSEPEVLDYGRALTWDGGGNAIEVQILKNGDQFQLPEWRASNEAVTQHWSVVDGVLIRPTEH